MRTRKFEIDQLASRTFSVVVHHGTSHILLETWSQDGVTNSIGWMEGYIDSARSPIKLLVSNIAPARLLTCLVAAN